MENGLSEFTLRWVKQLDGNILHKKEQEEEKEETEEEICAVTLTLWFSSSQLQLTVVCPISLSCSLKKITYIGCKQ